MANDDDLRFGDVDNGGSSAGGDGGIIDKLTEIFVALVFIYVILKVLEILFNIPIPFV